MKEDAGWGGSGSLAGKSLDFVHWFRCVGCFKDSSVIKYNYLAFLKVFLWFVFVIHGFFIFMINRKEAYSEPYKTSEVELFAKLVSNWKLLIFFIKNSVFLGYMFLLCQVRVSAWIHVTNPYSMVTWISRNSLLKTGAKSEV